MSNDDETHTSSALYKDSADWHDVQPIYNSIQEDAVVRIAHSEHFVDAFAYFRAVLHKNEMSKRAFELTTTCSQLNPANYSVWHYRRNLLKALKVDLKEEFRFTEEMIQENQKNYQLWHHRRVLVDWSKDPSRELDFTKSVLSSDSKNYHAWQHRQWVVEKYDLFSEDELRYSTELLEEDLRNNSAWNYRYFIVTNLSQTFTDEKKVGEEIEFTKQAITKISTNESAWSYLNGLLIINGIEANPQVLEFCKTLHEKDGRSTHLRLFLLDYYAQLLEKGENADANAQSALKLLLELKAMDPIRVNYYDYLIDRVNNLKTTASVSTINIS